MYPSGIACHMNRRGVLAAVLGGSLALAGCTQTDDESDREPVTIESHELVRDVEGTPSETVRVEGTVEIHVEDLQLVELRAKFLDDDGDIADTTIEVLDSLDPGLHQFAVRFPNEGDAAAAIVDYTIEVSTAL